MTTESTLNEIKQLKKEDIINQETFWIYCYKKAKENVFKNWSFITDEQKEIININEPIICKAFFKLHESFSLDSELEVIQKYYLNERVEEETKKCLKKYKSCTKIFTSRIEYFITKEIFH